jgi:hypothetical protein
MSGQTGSPYTRGAIYGLAAVCIWASFIVVSRLGVRTSLTPWDVAAIRFTVAGVLLLPYLVRRGLAVGRLGWAGVIVIIAGCGAPMVLLVNAGLLFASAAHGGALFPGVMPLMVAILATVILKKPLPKKEMDWSRGDCARCRGHRLGTWWWWCCRHDTNDWPRDVSPRGPRLGWLHSGDAACAARRTPCRRDRGGRLAGAIPTYLRKRRRDKRLQSPLVRHRAAGGCSGSSDRDCRLVALWSYGEPSGSNEWSRFRCPDASGDRADGHPGAWGMAASDRLGCHRSDFNRCLRSKRRTFAPPDCCCAVNFVAATPCTQSARFITSATSVADRSSLPEFLR